MDDQNLLYNEFFDNKKDFNAIVKLGLIDMIDMNKKQVSQNLSQLENIKILLMAIEQREHESKSVAT